MLTLLTYVLSTNVWNNINKVHSDVGEEGVASGVARVLRLQGFCYRGGVILIYTRETDLFF